MRRRAPRGCCGTGRPADQPLSSRAAKASCRGAPGYEGRQPATRVASSRVSGMMRTAVRQRRCPLTSGQLHAKTRGRIPRANECRRPALSARAELQRNRGAAPASAHQEREERPGAGTQEALRLLSCLILTSFESVGGFAQNEK